MSSHQLNTELYTHINTLCKKGQYNLVCHKHLGDVFYALGLKEEFEDTYNAKLHFIIPPEFEFLCHMYKISNYTTFDMKVYKKYIIENPSPYLQPAPHKSHPWDTYNLDLFSSLPLKDIPFICDTVTNSFCLWNHYWCYLWAYNLGLSEDFKFQIPQNKPVLSDEARHTLKQIAPLNKIVLVAPEAATATELSPEFWNILAEKVHQHGYTIIVNSQKYQIKYGISAFDLRLSLEDVVALGLSCAYVFALRSGLCDVLVGAKERLYTFYPAMLRREMNSLNECFEPRPNVHEISIYHWKIDDFIWEGENLSKALQKDIDTFYHNYKAEKLKYLFDYFSKKRNGHKWLYNIFNNVAGAPKRFFANNADNPLDSKYKDTKISFCKLKLYEKKIQQKHNMTHIKYIFFKGLLTFKKVPRHSWNLRILGIPVYSHDQEKDRLFGIKIIKHHFANKWLKKLDSKIPAAYDDVYILRHNIGETYVELMHIPERIKHQKSKHPLVLIWNKNMTDLYRMLVPKDIPLLYLPLYQSDIHKIFHALAENTSDICLKYGTHRFFCSTPQIAENMKELSKSNPDINFYTYIKDCISVAASAKPSMPKIDQTSLKKIQKKIRHLGLAEKFIILCPEATSTQELSKEFWQKITDVLIQKGYRVFCNDCRSQYTLHGTVSEILTIGELFALACESKGIVTLASGLAIFLTASKVPMDIIYTPFVEKKVGYDAQTSLKMYSVRHLPDISDAIREYKIDNQTEDELIENILSYY